MNNITFIPWLNLIARIQELHGIQRVHYGEKVLSSSWRVLYSFIEWKLSYEDSSQIIVPSKVRHEVCWDKSLSPVVRCTLLCVLSGSRSRNREREGGEGERECVCVCVCVCRLYRTFYNATLYPLEVLFWKERDVILTSIKRNNSGFVLTCIMAT